MKKTLALITLSLLVLGSIVSQAFAAYTTRIDDVSSNTTTAKHFYVGAKSETDFESDIKIAPGETFKSVFSITNKDEAISEVDIEVVMTLTLNSLITPLVISIETPESLSVTTIGNTYTFVMDADVLFEETFSVVVMWPEGDTSGSDNEFIGLQASYEVSVTGTQIINN